MATLNNLSLAACKVLTSSLELRVNQNLLIIADIDALSIADILTEIAIEYGIIVTTIYVPRVLQRSFHAESFFPDALVQMIGEVDAVISCLNDAAAYTAFRSKLLECAVDARRKVVHAPGLTSALLLTADTDYDEVRYRCEMLARAFLIGQFVEVYTVDSRGEEHRLIAKSEQWEVPPGISNGIINNGEWANLPPGETFFIPADGHGEIVINGSLPGKVLSASEELILRFINGQCIAIESEQSGLIDYFYETQINPAKAQEDANWCNFAELGFGVNSSINQLTGIDLIDEKSAGTVHVGLGRSDLIGGQVYSTIHCDLVTTGATVKVDGRELLVGGQWAMHEDEWLMDYHTLQLPSQWWEDIKQVRQSGSRVDESEQMLFRVWGNGKGRGATITVGNAETAFQAKRLYELLPKREPISKSTLIDRATIVGIPEKEVAQLLWIMQHYDLVRFELQSSLNSKTMVVSL